MARLASANSYRSADDRTPACLPSIDKAGPAAVPDRYASRSGSGLHDLRRAGPDQASIGIRQRPCIGGQRVRTLPAHTGAACRAKNPMWR
jgi:hypothetical protein